MNNAMRYEHCTHPTQDWCDCDWCRVIRTHNSNLAFDEFERVLWLRGIDATPSQVRTLYMWYRSSHCRKITAA